MKIKKDKRVHLLISQTEEDALNYLANHCDIPGVENSNPNKRRSEIIRSGIKCLAKQYAPPALYRRLYGVEPIEQPELDLFSSTPPHIVTDNSHVQVITRFKNHPKPKKEKAFQVVKWDKSRFDSTLHDKLIGMLFK